MDGGRVDPAALVIAVIVVGLQSLTEEGAWEPLNTVISAVVLGVAACFLWPARGTNLRYLLGFGIGIAFIAGVGLAWPIQASRGIPSDEASYWAVGVAEGAAALVILTVGVIRWARRRPATVSRGPEEIESATVSPRLDGNQRAPVTTSADDGVRDWVCGQLEELEDRARSSEVAYRGWRRRYESMHPLLGVPATVLAGVASISAFSEGSAHWVSGLLAAAAGALVGVQTLVRPDHRARFNQQQEFVMARIAFDALALRSIQLSVESLTSELRDLEERYFAAREQAAS